MKTKELFFPLSALALGALLLAGVALAHGPERGSQNGMGYNGNHMMGSGMMGGGMMGGSMMKYGGGYRGGVPCPANTSLEGPLTVDQVKSILENRLAMHGNDRLKIGSVTEKDDTTIIAEIITVDGSLVEKLAFNRQTGWHQLVQ